MSSKVGIVRNREEMQEALTRINLIKQQYPENLSDYNGKKINELATLCSLICISALEREESRGGHVRSDFPVESPLFVHHIIQEKDKSLSTETVRNNIP
jgi:L-aspartate oxidase